MCGTRMEGGDGIIAALRVEGRQRATAAGRDGAWYNCGASPTRAPMPGHAGASTGAHPRASAEPRDAVQPTKQQILDHLHRERRGTVRELARLLGLSAAGIRQHLGLLERDGLVQASEERGHVGRPAFVYSLTERGEMLYPKNYDVLANMLMEEVRAIAGADALQRVLRRIAARMAEQRMDRVEGKTTAERVAETATIMREMGCTAEFERKGDDFYLYQCTCPYPNVARRNSGVCALEVDYVRRLTGTDARLVTSLLRGDRACTYRIRPTPPPPRASSARAEPSPR